MASDNRVLDKRAICTFLLLFFSMIAVYLLQIPWQQYVRGALVYREQLSVVFSIALLCLVVLRIYGLWREKILPGSRRFGMFGPLVELVIDPLVQVSFFYSALFILDSMFAKDLALEPSLVVLLVSGYLLYYSLNGTLRLTREIFYIGKQRLSAPSQSRQATTSN